MPSQPNGYSRSNVAQHAVGDASARQTPWKPSQPATTSHSSSCSSPSCAKRIARLLGVEVVHARRRRPRSSSGAPVASRAAIRSFTTSCLAVDRDRCARRSARSAAMRWRSPSNCSSMPWWTSPSRAQPLADARPRRAGRPCPARARRRGCAARRTRGCALSSTTDSIPSSCEQLRQHQPGRAGADDRRPACASDVIRRARRARPGPGRRRRTAWRGRSGRRGGAARARSETTRRAPLMPSGWPSAIAPPLTFTRSSSRPSSRTTARLCEAKASFSSTRSISPTSTPARAEQLAHGRDRPDAHHARVDAGDGAADEARRAARRRARAPSPRSRSRARRRRR